MKRRGFLMGLLAAPIAGVATKEIIERINVEPKTLPDVVDEHPEYRGKGLTQYTSTESEDKEDLARLIHAARIRNEHIARLRLEEYTDALVRLVKHGQA